MAITHSQQKQISELLEKKLNAKLKKYARESVSMPFLTRLIQNKEQVAAYSFIHSLATTLGMSMYEDISVILARDSAVECFRNYDIGGVISKEQSTVIADIIAQLRNGERRVNHKAEVEEVLKASAVNGSVRKEGRIADFYMLKDGIKHFIEIKTAKPNLDVFTKSKQKLLEWVARNRQTVRVFVALPYNPYYPQPYERFTEKGMLQRGEEFLVGKEYWDYIGGPETFENLLELFNETGDRFKHRIAEKISEVAQSKLAQ